LNKGTMYQRMGNLYRKWNVPKIIQKSRHIITVSDFEKNEIVNYFPQLNSKVSTVYNAQSYQFRLIDNIEELVSYKEKYNLPDYYILCLGNTHPNKNLKNVLSAYKILQKYEQTSIPLVIP